MKRLLLISCAAFSMTMGAAMAQTVILQGTVPTAPAPVPPPPGTLSTTTTQRSVGPDGTQTESTGTTYRDDAGTASESTTRTTTYPAPPPPTTYSTTKTTTTTTNTQ